MACLLGGASRLWAFVGARATDVHKYLWWIMRNMGSGCAAGVQSRCSGRAPRYVGRWRRCFASWFDELWMRSQACWAVTLPYSAHTIYFTLSTWQASSALSTVSAGGMSARCAQSMDWAPRSIARRSAAARQSGSLLLCRRCTSATWQNFRQSTFLLQLPFCKNEYAVALRGKVIRTHQLESS